MTVVDIQRVGGDNVYSPDYTWNKIYWESGNKKAVTDVVEHEECGGVAS